MNYILTEGQYERLLNASRKRHAKDPERNVKGGMFNFNGHLVKYSVVNRNEEFIYVNYEYESVRKMTYIMKDEDFIQLDKKEQENRIEFKIKKDIEKQKLK
jgi:hypothetical protein